MKSSFRFLLVPYLLALILAVVALVGLWYGLGRAVVLEDAVTATHRLQCASYTPFAKDQSPLRTFTVRPEQVDADFALLARHFQCVRTYSMTGLEALPELARKHGLKVMMGAWINNNEKDNEKELEALIRTANAYPDVVRWVVVGNETLLRKEISGPQLAALIQRVKSQIRQPVTYADVWEFWNKHPQVAPAVDFITIHLLPYWEDEPRGIEDALQHVAAIREEFGRRFAPKDVVVGETGWPSEGRQRETAVPSRVNEARFLRGFVALAEKNGWRYNLIEAMDQPWKRINEGAVGGYWGVFDADRQDKGVLAGPVSNVSNWPLWLVGSLVLWLASLLLAGRPETVRSAFALPLAAALGSACIGLWGELAWVTSRFAWEWLWAAALVVLNTVILSNLVLALSAREGWRGCWFKRLQARGGWGLTAAAFAGAVSMLGLVLDARYRSFPSAAFVLPALFYIWRPVRVPYREGLLLALFIGLGIIPQLLEEGLRNTQALCWGLVSLLLTAALWRSLRLTLSKRSGLSDQPQG